MAGEEEEVKYELGVVRSWNPAEDGLGYGQLMYVDELFNSEVNIAFQENGLREGMSSLLAVGLNVMFKKDDLEMFAEDIYEWKEDQFDEKSLEVHKSQIKRLKEEVIDIETVLLKGIIRVYDGERGEILFFGKFDDIENLNLSATFSSSNVAIENSKFEAGDFVSFRRSGDNLVVAEVCKINDLRLFNKGEKDDLENLLQETNVASCSVVKKSKN